MTDRVLRPVLTECLDLCESGDEAGPSGGS